MYKIVIVPTHSLQFCDCAVQGNSRHPDVVVGLAQDEPVLVKQRRVVVSVALIPLQKLAN